MSKDSTLHFCQWIRSSGYERGQRSQLTSFCRDGDFLRAGCPPTRWSRHWSCYRFPRCRCPNGIDQIEEAFHRSDVGRYRPQGGIAFQADKSNYRGVLAGLEGITGKKAVNSEPVTVKN